MTIPYHQIRTLQTPLYRRLAFVLERYCQATSQSPHYVWEQANTILIDAQANFLRSESDVAAAVAEALVEDLSKFLGLSST